MAAHHQVAAANLADIDFRWQGAADVRTQLFEPGAITLLTREFIEVVCHVLRQQAARRQQVEQDPAEHASPGDALWLTPFKLQRFVVQFEQSLLAQTRLVARHSWLFTLVARGLVRLLLFVRLVVEITQARLVYFVEIIGDWLLASRDGWGELGRGLGLGCGNRFGLFFSRLQCEAVALALQRLITQQGFGPGFVMGFFVFIRGAAGEVPGVAGRLFQGEELLGQLLLLLFQPGQLLVEVEAVQIEVVVNPQRIVNRPLCWRLAAGVGLSLADRSACRFGWRSRCRAWAEELLGSIEHVQAGTTAHCTMGSSQLCLADTEAGTAMGALGDVAFAHARVRKIQAASLKERLQAASHKLQVRAKQPGLHPGSLAGCGLQSCRVFSA